MTRKNDMKTGTLRFVLLNILILAACLVSYPQSKLSEGGVKGVTSILKNNKGPQKPSKPGKANTSPAKPANQKTVQNNADSKSDKGYIDILDIKFANTDNSSAVISKYGSKLYASEIKFLKPEIVYEGHVKDPQEIEFQVSLYDGEGEMKRGKNSPEGCTYIANFTVKPGRNEQRIIGWGSSQGGTYTPGEYRIEISHKGEKIYSKDFRLYSGETPIVDNPIFEIKNITYCSADKDNNKLTESGADLYEDNLYYLSGNMDYVGKCKNDQSVKLFIKIFNADGNLIKGANSPEGFSYTTNLTLKQGSNSITTGGYGNSNGDTYQPGKIKLEYWLDGDKIYENWVIVKERKHAVSNHDYVDLGLPSGTLWATCNVGANKPEETGMYFAWGETEPKSIYTHSNSKYYNMSQQKLADNSIVDASGKLTPTHDVATIKLGSSWRMPTVTEITELDKNCTWTWTSINGSPGFRLTGPNGNSIFLPATGWYNSASNGMLDCVGERSEYWSSSVRNGDDESAHCLFFMNPDSHYAGTGHSVQRSRGLAVRPVYIRK